MLMAKPTPAPAAPQCTSAQYSLHCLWLVPTPALATKAAICKQSTQGTVSHKGTILRPGEVAISPSS